MWIGAGLICVGMFLMLDIVVNNMAYNGNPNNIDYSTLSPFNNAGDFHPFCPINYADRTSTLNVYPLKKCGTDSVLDGRYDRAIAGYQYRKHISPKHY